MTDFARDKDLRGAEFTDVDLRGARFIESDLSGAVMRGMQVDGLDIDDPFLFNGETSLLVNGVDVVPLLERELNSRYPGREHRRAENPAGLQAAWAAVEATWAATLERVSDLPTGVVDVSVAGEWSFAQTLRHLILATDLWIGQAVLQTGQLLHPIGLRYTEPGEHGAATSQRATVTPTYDEVLEVRADRVAMVRDYLVSVTQEELAAPRKNPHNPETEQTVLSCLHVILTEEWEHHRYAVRDLAAAARDGRPQTR